MPTELLPDGFELVRVLGQGAHGWVACARQSSLDRLVAVKVMPRDPLDGAAARRLEREGRAIAALDHPNVVRVFELLLTPTSTCLVMELVDGGDLRSALATGGLTGAAAVRVLRDVAAGLGHAHRRGLVHRDVKPANVLLRSDGRASIADFGLTRLPHGSFRTMAGVAAGTPTYMAPEQIRDPDAQTPAVDAYAFATVAYEVLTGRRPYATSSIAETLRAHLEEEPIPPRAHVPDLPAEVEAALLAGLAKDPAGRADPEAITAALQCLSGDEWDHFFREGRPQPVPSTLEESTVGPDAVVPAPPAAAVSPRPQPPRTPRRRRIPVSALLLGSGVGIAGGVALVSVLR